MDWTSISREGWSCLLCVYPQLLTQSTSVSQQGSSRSPDYPASAKWSKTGLILFELQHLSQLNGPISSLKQEKAKRKQEGSVPVVFNQSYPPVVPQLSLIPQVVRFTCSMSFPKGFISQHYDLTLGFTFILKHFIHTATVACLPDTNLRRQKSNLHSLFIQTKCQQSSPWQVLNWVKD